MKIKIESTANRLSAQINPLCASCQDGYYQWNDSCVPCHPTTYIPLFIGLIVLSFFATVVLHHLFSERNFADATIFLSLVQLTGIFLQPLSLAADKLFSAFNLDFHRTTGSTCILPLSPTQSLIHLWIQCIQSVED